MDPVSPFPLPLLLHVLRVNAGRVAHPLGRLAVAKVLLQDGVADLPLVHLDATVPAPDDHLQWVRLVLLVRQVETCRRELRWGEDPWLLLPLERLRSLFLADEVDVLRP